MLPLFSSTPFPSNGKCSQLLELGLSPLRGIPARPLYMSVSHSPWSQRRGLELGTQTQVSVLSEEIPDLSVPQFPYLQVTC